MLIILSVAMPIGTTAGAQETTEGRAFRAAAAAFNDGVFHLAERKFQQFVASYPNSPLLHEAVLLQAQAALKQTNLTSALVLLNAHVGQAGLLTDQFRYWIANVNLRGSNYVAAAESFALIARQFTNSPLLLEAGYGEALARFKLRDLNRVINILRDPGGAFQRAAKVRTQDELTIRGHLLLAEALLEQRRYKAAEDEAAVLSQKLLTPEFAWDRQYLVCRVQMADQRLEEALANSTNLLRLASQTSNRALVTDSIALQAGILHQMNRLPEAIEVLSTNLGDTTPWDRQRTALLSIIELKIAQNRIADADQQLKAFLAAHPEDAASDLALLTSGELHLRMHLNERATAAAGTTEPAPVTGTNHLQQALAQFEKLIALHTNSPWRGKAILNKGWCLWLDQKIPQSAVEFRLAAEVLPPSEDQAIARFKLGDTLQLQGNHDEAIQVFRALTNDFAHLPRVREDLFDQALYQMVRAHVSLGNEAAATDAVQQILESHPESIYSQRSMWLVGEELIRVRKPAEARAIFYEFVRRFPGQALVPKVELAIARTYFHEGDWKLAMSSYQEWMKRYPTNTLRPRAAFNLAWSTDKAGLSTNAFQLFTNFVAAYPTHELAPLAQHWVADQRYQQRDYEGALRNYQLIVENTNWPKTNLTYQARMMAGRSAFAAQLWKSAEDHFTGLLNDLTRDDELIAEAFFALGDTRRKRPPTPANSLQNFVEGRNAYQKIPQLYPHSRLVPLALGSIGDCSLQLAAQDAKEYESATNAYTRAMTHPLADITVRSQAEYGLARALELQAPGLPPEEASALLKTAFEHYYNIVIGDNRKGDEEADPFWLEKAGLAAARLAEEQKQWSIALNIYQRLQTVEALSPLWPRLEDRIKKVNRAREQTSPPQN